MKRGFAALIGLCAATLFAGSAMAQTPAFKPVEKKDPALDALLSSDAKLERVATGFGFTEGVTWAPQGKSGYLLFSDIPANVVYRMGADGKATIFREKSGYQKSDLWRVGMPFTNGKKEDDPGFERFNMSGSNGLALDRQGRLVIAAFGGRAIERIEKNGKRTVLADRYQGKRLNGPNDVVVRKDGSIYFTDTFGGLLKLDKDPAKELNELGLYMIRDGKVTQIIDDIDNPNGLAFSPDEKTFYANGGRDRFIRRYDVKADGTVENGAVLVDFSANPTPGITDGMKVDTQGNVWTTGPGGVWVIAPTGKALGVIPLPEGGTNLAFGDGDRKTLYISARTSIYKIRTNVAGLP